MAHTHILPKARWQATAAISACSLLISSVVTFSGPPQWWFERGVIDENAQEENYSAVNAGQAKWMATQAHAELSERLAPFGGVDFELEDVFPEVPANPDAEWYEKQKAPLNLGQLKAISKPFYDNLNRVSPGFLNFQAGINGVPWQQGQAYPWNPDTPVEENLALANIGQLKSTFAFQFGVDSDSDGIADFWEFGATAQAAGGIVEGLAALGGNGANSDGDYLSDTEEFALGTDPFDANSVAGIEWADSRNVEIERTAEGSAIHKSRSGNQWNAAAVTALAMQADGSVSFEFSITGVSAMVGFNYANTNWAHTDIAHAFFLSGNSLHIRENNRNIHTHGNYTLGDQLKITREGEQIRYFVNDVLIYTSELASPRPVFAKVVAHHQFAGVEKLQIEGFTDLDTDRDGLIDSWEIAVVIEANTTDNYRTLADVEPLGDIDQDGLSNLTEHYNNSDPVNTPHQGWLELQWQDLRNTIAENSSDQFGSSLAKSAVGNGYNADGNSARTITGDGGISFRAGRDFTRILCGLDSGDGSIDSASFTDIDFCIYLDPRGVFFAYENGRNVKTGGHYGAGDSFSVERDGDSILYKKNGEEFHRSEKESIGALIADCSIHRRRHSIVNTLIRGVAETRDIDGDGIAYNVEYAALSKLPRTEAQSIAGITAQGDIDGDGLTNILEVTNGTDLADIYTAGGSVDWPTDAIVAWYRTDGENAVIADSSDNLTRWPNFAGENYDIIPTVTTAGRIPIVTPGQGDAFTNLHAASNQPTHIDQQNTDLLNAADGGFTILTAFTPTEDLANGLQGILDNERFGRSGFRFGIPASDKFQWWAGQSGGSLNVSSRKTVEYGTNYQITLRHTAETLSSLHINGSLEAVAQQTVIHPNTRNIRLNFIGRASSQPTDWHELIIANRALSYGEQTLLEDYLAAKHRGEGPLAEDINGNGIADWQDIEGVGTSALHTVADSDDDGLNDAWELEHFNNLDQTAETDFDEDSIPDGKEFEFDLDPTDKLDAVRDHDGDRFPSIYEILAGHSPRDSDDVPSYEFIVDGSIAEEDLQEGEFNTIQAAVEAAGSVPDITNQIPAFILIKPGLYEEQVVMGLSSSRTRFVLHGDYSGEVRMRYDAPPRGNINRVCVSSRNGRICSLDGIIIEANEGFGSGSTNGEPIIVSNCIFRVVGVVPRTGSFVESGGPLVISHCTMFGPPHRRGGSTHDVSGRSSMLWVDNSICWASPYDDVAGHYNPPFRNGGSHDDLSILGMRNSFIEGGLYGAREELPELTRSFLVAKGSNVIDRGAGNSYVQFDIHGERRDIPDVGADEFVDADEDGLADVWERETTGSLALGSENDDDGDGFSAIEEYQFGVELMSPVVNDDTDADGLPDILIADTPDDETPVNGSDDADGDGLTAREEFRLGLSDETSDTDHDGIPDGAEIELGLNPNFWEDGYQDMDGDRVPNLYEYLQGTDLREHDINDPTKTPAANFIVDNSPNPVADSFRTLREVLLQVNRVQTEICIIRIKPGDYEWDHLRNRNSYRKPLLILGDSNTSEVDASGNPKFVNIATDVSPSGQHSLFYDGLYFTDHESHFDGRTRSPSAIYTINSSNSVGFRNCLFRNTRNRKVISPPQPTSGRGWAIHNLLRSRLYVSHCSFFNDYDFGENSISALSPRHIVTQHGTRKQLVEHSAFYDPSGIVPAYVQGAVLNAHFRNCVHTSFNSVFATAEDPQWTQVGFPQSTSSTVNIAAVSTNSRDIFGQPRDSKPDIGAIEWLDSDGDGLPDWLEQNGDLLAEGNEDGDGLDNIAEFELGTPVFHSDIDGDGVLDQTEVDLGTSANNADTDGDGMNDGYEIEHGLDPLDSSDSLRDLDGDGLANLYEMLHSKDPTVAMSLEELESVADWIIDLEEGGDLSTDNVVETLEEAFDQIYASTSDPNEHYIVAVRAGRHLAPSNRSTQPSNDNERRSMLLVGTSGGEEAVILLSNDDEEERFLRITGRDSVVSHLAFEPVRGFGSKMGRIHLSVDESIDSQTMFTNCIVRGAAVDRTSFEHILIFGTGSHYVLNCTVIANEFSQDIILNTTVSGVGVFPNANTKVDFENSLIGFLYDRSNRFIGGRIIVNNVNSVFLDPSDASSFYESGINRQGYLLSDSPHRNKSNASATLNDFRSVGALDQRDLGAHEFVDADGDLIDDFWEILHHGTSNHDGSFDNDEGVGDGATQFEEYIGSISPSLRDTDRDGFIDGDELHRESGATDPLNPDSDYDRMPDGYEIAHDLDPLDRHDTILDRDGDRIPNLHEFLGGTSPSDKTDYLSPDFIVDPSGEEPNSFPSVNHVIVHLEAERAKGEELGDYKYKIVSILPGLYDVSVEVDKRLLVDDARIAELRADLTLSVEERNRRIETIREQQRRRRARTAMIDFSGLEGLVLMTSRDHGAGFVEIRANDSSLDVLYSDSASANVIDGLVISRQNVPGLNSNGGEGVILNPVSVSSSVDSRVSGRSCRISNCVLKEHWRGSGALIFGPTGNSFRNHIVRPKLYVDHCSFVNNSALTNRDAKSVHKRVRRHGTIEIRNSVLWNPNGNQAEHRGLETNFGDVILNNRIRGVDSDPSVNQRFGFLQPGSNAINTGVPLPGSTYLYDYTGELRDGVNDIGADEFVDRDGDGLSDSFEVEFGLSVSTADTNGDGIPDGRDSDQDGTPDGEEDEDGDGLTNLQENAFDENPNVFNIVESVTPNVRSIDVRDEAADKSVSYTVNLYRTDPNVTLHMRKFDFAMQTIPGLEDRIDITDFGQPVVGSDSIHSIALSELASANRTEVTWDSTVNGVIQGADVVFPVVEMVDSNGVSHFHEPFTDFYVPEIPINQMSLRGGGSQNFFQTVWTNSPHSGVFGSEALREPVLLHHKLFPSLVNKRPLIGVQTVNAWIPFEANGIPWAETADAWMETVGSAIEGDDPATDASLKQFSARRLPQASVAYINQSADFIDYSVESYISSAAHGEVVHAVFTLDREAEISLTLVDPNGTQRPLFHRDPDTGNYINTVNITCPAGENDLEFYAMDYASTPERPKVFDNRDAAGLPNDHGFFRLNEVNGNPISTREYRRQWRVKFDLRDKRTGNVRTRWALVTISNE